MLKKILGEACGHPDYVEPTYEETVRRILKQLGDVALGNDQEKGVNDEKNIAR